MEDDKNIPTISFYSLAELIKYLNSAGLKGLAEITVIKGVSNENE